MNPSAHVTSVAALADLQAAFAQFRVEGQEALASITLEVRRAFDWLNDQRQFWKRTIRDCEDRVTRAKAILVQRQTVFSSDRVPDCSEQEEELELAQRALGHAEDQEENCRQWQRRLQRAVEEYDGSAVPLAGQLDGDVPRAVALLERLRLTLEDYLAIKPVEAARPAPPANGPAPGTV